MKESDDKKKKDKLLVRVILLSVAVVLAAGVISYLFGKKAGKKKAEEEIAILEKTENLSWVEGWKDVTEIYADPGFKHLSDEQKEHIIEGALEQLRDSYGFSEYELALKNYPANVLFIYPDGRREAFTLEDFNQDLN